MIFENRKVVVCAGTGGVGKTTVSASLAVAAAASGRRTLVMTIDPARRLANALGLADFGNVEREIPASALAPYGVTLKAPLFAMMPDVKSTFDGLVERFMPDAQRRADLQANTIYKQFSTVVAGSLEYAAVEKLYEVYASGRYDLIVLDTPPSQNAKAFLSAPGRVIDFLAQDTVQWLLKPYVLAGKLSLKLLDFGTSFVLSTLGRFAGAETIRALADFVLYFQGMYDGFRERSEGVRTLLASPEVAFVLVSVARAREQEALLRFRDELLRAGLTTRAVIQNRVRELVYAPGDEAALEARLTAMVPDTGDLETLLTAIREEQALALVDQAAIESLRVRLPHTRIVALPELPLDAHDLESLARLQKAFQAL
jgi:anion-transporting  ArsA/GET3 family ATPase